MNYSLTKKQAKDLIKGKLSHYFGVSIEEATDEQYYKSVALIVKDLMHDGLVDFRADKKNEESKRFIISAWNSLWAVH